MWDGHGPGWGFWPIGWAVMGFFWLVIIGLLIWAAVTWLPRARSGSDHGAPATPHEPQRRETPEEILDRRFANGEIDVEQYRRARQELVERRSDKSP